MSANSSTTANLVDVTVYEDDTDDYDLDSTSSGSSDSDVIYDSENDVGDDDILFDENVDKDVEFVGFGTTRVTKDYTSLRLFSPLTYKWQTY